MVPRPKPTSISQPRHKPAPLARRGHRRRRRGRGQPAAAEQRPRHRASAAGPGRLPAQPGLGSGRAWDGRDVELELGDCLAAGQQRPAGRRDLSSGWRTGPGMAGRVVMASTADPRSRREPTAEARCTLVSLVSRERGADGLDARATDQATASAP